jgi:antitoxin ParD1/3/4
MANIEKVSVALTSEQIEALRSAVDTGEYATTSEIVREAVRDWQMKRELQRADVKRLRRSWDEGKASGAARPLDLPALKRQARSQLAKAKKAGRGR